jgi:sulfur carrier protein
MRISLNGEQTDAKGAQTVAELVRSFELPSDAVLIEHNGVALLRAEWGRQRLNEGDRLEIIRVVAGG